jgi:hypothetical protein
MKEAMATADIQTMTAPRTCRACGAPLHGDVRWCLRCYQPARELTARAAVWAPGEFVDNPVHTGGPVPHWSRWEKSATTFGPAGRVIATVVAALCVLGAAGGSPLTLIFVLPVGGMVLRAIWMKGWVVPGVEAAPPPSAPVSSWLWDRSEFVRTLMLAAVTLTGIGLLMYSPDPVVRFVVIATGVVVGCFTVSRKIGGSR